ncbi:MAG: efflux RND transporter periplasmic adaptor subunit [Myxococcales bacterium]|nr:efflux RND transporter periplasmic adaptor subunit [Myxococcales bacterium]
MRRSACALVIVLAACGSEPTTRPVEVPRDARVGVVADAGARIVDAPDRGYVGVITAAESVDIAPRFQGVLATVKVRVGDRVAAGQVVAEMDPKSMQEEVRAVEAALGAAIAARRQAEVDVQDARRRLALETRAVADGVSARTAIEEAQLAVKRAEAASQRASSAVSAESSRVQTARDHVADTALRAPSEGTVAMRFKDPGSIVTAGAPIIRLVGRLGLRLRFATPPEQAHRLVVGGTVYAAVETVTVPIPAVIRQVSPVLDPASGMVMVEAELGEDVTKTVLRPGLAATVRDRP